jgi:OOP family OmpA-OmpF porin
MRWTLPEVLTVAILATLALLFPPWLDPGAAGANPEVTDGSALDPPRLVLEHRVGKLLVSGMARSAAHEADLLRLAREQFADSDIGTDLRPGVLFPSHWEAASRRLLHALAATESGVAVLESGAARIRGVTSDPAGLASRLAALREELPVGASVVEDVTVVGQTASLDELCLTNFANAVTEQVAFRQSSAELRTSAYAVLDKLIDLANDCRGNRIAVIGHTDSTGNENWNRALSRARAQSVADYLVRGGIQPQRLIVEGVGSADPVADNDTAYGRRQNRRIEFELR